MLQQRELVLQQQEMVLQQREMVLQQRELVLQQREMVLQQQELMLQQQESGVAATGTDERLIYGPKMFPSLQSDSFEVFVLSHSLKLKSAK